MSILDRSTFFIKEHVGMMKLVDRYDIHDPDTNENWLRRRAAGSTRDLPQAARQ